MSSRRRKIQMLLSLSAGVGALAATPVAVAALSSGPTPPSTPAGTRAVYQTPTSGTFVNSGGQVVGGWAELTSPSSAAAAQPQTTVSAGGGTWNYGSYVTGSQKVCYSNYLHNSKRHSATAEMNPAPNYKAYANAGSWAQASTNYYANYAGICNVYWNTY